MPGSTDDDYQRDKYASFGAFAAAAPPMLPLLPQLRLAGQYLDADGTCSSGGGWCEAVPLGHGRAALAVGEAVGEHPQADHLQQRLRREVTTSLLGGMSLSQVLARLRHHAGTSASAPATGTGACLAVLDPQERAVEYGGFGSCAPLVVELSGATRLLPDVAARPLGPPADPSLIFTSRLAAGDVLVLCSRTVWRRPDLVGHDTPDELSRLVSTAVDQTRLAPGPEPVADGLCSRTVQGLIRTGYSDNVALLVAELRVHPHRPLVLSLPAEGSALRVIRRALTEWLHEMGADEEELPALHLAVVEAASNCVEHAYSETADSEGRMWVGAILDGDGRLRILVADYGRWRPPRPEPRSRGRGLRLMRNLMDTVQVCRSERGTAVSMSRRMRRPIGYVRASGSGAQPDISA